MWAVVGLGNPGSAYARTRHNAGFLFIRRVARDWGLSLNKRRFQAKMAETKRKRQTVALVQPQTFMNLCGMSVRELLRAKKLAPERLVVVYDDLDLPLGRIRVRKEGSAGTHKGLRSVIQEIGTTAFPRIRLGIGPRPESVEATDYVLSEFEPEEAARFELSLDRAKEAMEMILEGQISAAMNRYNAL